MSRLSQFRAVLPMGDTGVVGADVFEEEEAAPGFEHSPELPHRAGLVVDAAQDTRVDTTVSKVASS